MDDLYNILGVPEDDIVVDVRYCILYILHKDILDLREEWVHVDQRPEGHDVGLGQAAHAADINEQVAASENAAPP